MRFKYPIENPEVILELPGRLLPCEDIITPRQHKRVTLGGTPVVYAIASATKIYKIRLRLNEEQKGALLSFFEEHTQWSLNSFRLEFHDGSEYIVRFWSDKLVVKQEFVAMFRIDFEVLIEGEYDGIPPT